MKKGDSLEIHFIYAPRSKDEAIFLNELKTRAAGLGNTTLYRLFLDKGGFAPADVAKEKLPEALTTYEFFICGTKQIVEGLLRNLRKEGVKRSRIHTEAFEFR